MKQNVATASYLFSELPVRSSPRQSSITWPRIRKSSITWPRLPTQRPTRNVISSNFGVNLPKKRTFQELRSLAGSGSIRSIGGTLLLRHAEQLGVAIPFVPSLRLSEV